MTLIDPADFDLVLVRWLRDVERIAADRLLLTFDAAAAAAVCSLAERVPYGLEVGLQDGRLLAEISVPAADVDLLDDVVLRIEGADLRTLQRRSAPKVP